MLTQIVDLESVQKLAVLVHLGSVLKQHLLVLLLSLEAIRRLLIPIHT